MIPERRRFLAALGAVCLAALYVEANRQAILSSAFPSSVARKSRSLPDFLWGVTADEVTDLQAISKSMKALPVMPITRVVFNPPRPPSAYRHAVEALHPITYMMGQPVDSSEVKHMDLSTYGKRFSKYLQAFGDTVDLWEVGNEINGEWLGSTEHVVSLITRAYDIVSAAGKLTALTFYYQPRKTVSPGHEMIAWAKKHVPASIKQGLDYALVSYYEVDNDNIRPTPMEWTRIFSELSSIFRNAKVGFGEIGLNRPADSKDLARAENIMEYYYGLNIPLANYVGGYFWWYFAEDCVPDSKPLFKVLKKLV